MKARGWTVIAIAVLLSGCAVAAAIGLRSDPKPPTPPAETSTATVQRTDLVQTHTIDGEIGYGAATPLPTHLAGTITAVPTAGRSIHWGERLYGVDNRPVVLLSGSLPAYRELSPGSRGRDVRQLEESLRRLGYHDFLVDTRYTWATAEAVRAWQHDNRLDCTGIVELGRVVFWPTEVRVDSVAVTPGQAIAAGDVVLAHTSTERIVTADLDAASVGMARIGASVQVSLPQGRPVTGHISAVSTAIEASPADDTEGQSSAPSDPTVELTVKITDQQALGSITGAPVEIRLTGERRTQVLTVPVAALLALREGGHGVEVIDQTGRHIVPVSTGMFAAGRVEVSGAGITEGIVIGTATP